MKSSKQRVIPLELISPINSLVNNQSDNLLLPNQSFLKHSSSLFIKTKIETNHTIPDLRKDKFRSNYNHIYSHSKPILQKAVRRLIYIFRFKNSSVESNPSNQTKIAELVYRRRSLLPLYPDDYLVIFWNYFIQVLHFFATILYPFFIAFINYGSNHSQIWSDIILFFFFVFLFDIVINFLICQQDENNKLLIKYAQIAKFYFKGWFFSDLISILPYETFFENNYKNEFSLEDYFQIFKLIRIIKYFNGKPSQRNFTNDENGNQLEIKEEFLNVDIQFVTLLKIALNTLILSHVFACLFYFAARFEKFNHQSWVNLIPNEDLITIYVTAYYWITQTVTVVGYGDISSKASVEITLVVFWMLVGVGFYSFTIGNLTSILLSQDTSKEYNEDINIVNELTDKVEMPDIVAEELFNYVRYNILKNPFWSASGKRIINSLPSTLRNFMVLTVNGQLLCRVSFFQHDVNFSTVVLPLTTLQAVSEGDAIYREGQPSNEIYYLLDGQVQVMLEDQSPLITIAEGQVFGEIEAIEQRKRQFYCYAIKPSVILICPAKIYLKIVQEDQLLFFEFNELYKRRRYLISDAVRKITSMRRLSKVKLNSEGSPQFRDSFSRTTIKKDTFQLQRRKGMREPTTTNQQAAQSKLIQFLVGHKQKRKQEIRKLFQKSIKKIIHLWKKFVKATTPDPIINKKDETLANILFIKSPTFKSQLTNQQIMQKGRKSLIKNFNKVCREENKLKEFLQNHRRKYQERIFQNKCSKIIKSYQKFCGDRQQFDRQIQIQYARQQQLIYDKINQEKQFQQSNLINRKQTSLRLIKYMRSEKPHYLFSNLNLINKDDDLMEQIKKQMQFELQDLEEEIAQLRSFLEQII